MNTLGLSDLGSYPESQMLFGVDLCLQQIQLAPGVCPLAFNLESDSRLLNMATSEMKEKSKFDFYKYERGIIYLS